MPRMNMAAIAATVGVHKSTVSRQCRAAGLVGADGLVDLEQYRTLRAGALDPALQTTGTAAARAPALIDPDAPVLAAERARKMAADAQLAELELQRKRGELLQRDLVASRAQAVFERALARLSEALPACAVPLATMTDQAAIADLLSAELRRALAGVHQEFMEDVARRAAG
jgi:hypothetical protein